MSYQAYLDNIQAKTGKTVNDFRVIARKKGISKETFKHGDVIAWLESDFGLGHGHANLIAQLVLNPEAHNAGADERIAKLFAGSKSGWRKPYDTLMAKLAKFGKDIEVVPTDTYAGITRSGKKFALVQPSTARLDIGVKLKGVAAGERLEASGTWNNMVTHRVRISDAKQIDAELIAWLKQAYEVA